MEYDPKAFLPYPLLDRYISRMSNIHGLDTMGDCLSVKCRVQTGKKMNYGSKTVS